ncbi:NUDIX domain-containing protein [Nostoc sp. CHAB 5834]|nr:NUDIX domain-containing protein [Nostoc sp. CHAB 5834]
MQPTLTGLRAFLPNTYILKNQLNQDFLVTVPPVPETISQIDEMLKAYLSMYPQERRIHAELLEKLSQGVELFDRKNMDGHITCTALVLSPDRKSMLLINHNSYKSWMPPGGHNEDAEPLFQCAAREVLEETGLADISPYLLQDVPLLLDLDTHEIPARPAKNEGVHRHHDFMFLAYAKEFGPLSHQESETGGAEWRLLTDSVPGNLRVTRALQKLQRLQAIL